MKYYFVTAPGRSDLYWRPDSQGYTTNKAQAGIYTENVAQGILRNQRGDRIWEIDKDTIAELAKIKDERQNDIYLIEEMFRKLMG